MPKNNGEARRYARQEEAKHRQATYDMEYGPVADREAKRGYPAKLNALADRAVAQLTDQLDRGGPGL
jgi:hypothetical protein